MKFRIDRRELPYDAFVNDPSWLSPINDDEENCDTGKNKRKKDDTESDISGNENIAE